MAGRFVSPLVSNHADEITPHDTNPNQWSRIYVGGTGDVAVVTEDGTSVVFKAVPVGTFIDLRTSKVMSTGTTATFLVGMKLV